MFWKETRLFDGFFKAAAWRTDGTNHGRVETPVTSQSVVGVFLDGRSGFASARSQRGEAGRGGEGDAAQAHVQAVHLGGDRHLGEKGAVPRQPGQSSSAAAVAALDVFDDVEDLLTFRLSRHPPDVQNGRHVLLPEHREDETREESNCTK